jgi:hypothetical protein
VQFAKPLFDVLMKSNAERQNIPNNAFSWELNLVAETSLEENVKLKGK